MELRLRNVIHEGDLRAAATTTATSRARRRCARRRRPGLGQPKPGPYVGRGLALVDRGIGGGETGVILRLPPTATWRCATGVPDQGVGMSTMLRQVVAEALGLPIEQVTAVPSDTDTVPYDAGGGREPPHLHRRPGRAKAAEELAARLSAAAAALLDAAPEAVQRQNGAFRADGRAVAFAAVAERAARDAGGHLDVKAEVNMPYPDQTCFSAQVAEVEVDPETGQVHLRG